MFSRIRPRSGYDVVALLALVIAVGGASAYAAGTVFSTDIVDGEVKTQDLAADAVTQGKLSPDSVSSGKVVNETLTGSDLKDNGVKGADVDESSLELTNGRSSRDSLTSNCHANSGPMACTKTTLPLPHAARVLLIATANWKVDSFNDFLGPDSSGDVTTAAWGSCEIFDNGVVVPNTLQRVGEGETDDQTEPNSDSWSSLQGHGVGGNMAVTTVTGVLPAGAHEFVLTCQEEDGNVGWFRASLSAVMLGPGPAAVR